MAVPAKLAAAVVVAATIIAAAAAQDHDDNYNPTAATAATKTISTHKILHSAAALRLVNYIFNNVFLSIPLICAVN